MNNTTTEHENKHGLSIYCDLPFPCYSNGVRGFSCPKLKLYGLGTIRALVTQGKRVLDMPDRVLQRKGIYLNRS